MKRAVVPILLALLLLCSCTAKMKRYPTQKVYVFSAETEREQTLNAGQTVGVACTAPSAVQGISVVLPTQNDVTFLLYIYTADKDYSDTVGKDKPIFKKEIAVSAAQGEVTVYFNGPDAGNCYVVLEAKTTLKTVFCLPAEGFTGYADGQISATVPKITLLCE